MKSKITLFLLTFFILVLPSFKSIAQPVTCDITGINSGDYTFAGGKTICFYSNANLGSVTFENGTKIYIAPNVTVNIQNNVTSSGTINLEIDGTLQFNQSVTINANVNLNIGTKGILRAGSLGNTDFTLNGNGINNIINNGQFNVGVLGLQNPSGTYTFDSSTNAAINIKSNINITGKSFFRNQGKLLIGSSYNCNEKSVFVNCGEMTSSAGFNLGGGKVINTGKFTVNSSRIDFGSSKARFENYGSVDVEGSMNLGGTGCVYYNEGTTVISGTFQNDGNIEGPANGTGKLGYITWNGKASMNSGSIGPNLNLINSGGTSSKSEMFNNPNSMTILQGVVYKCTSCPAPQINSGAICREPNGNTPIGDETCNVYTTVLAEPTDALVDSLNKTGKGLFPVTPSGPATLPYGGVKLEVIKNFTTTYNQWRLYQPNAITGTINIKGVPTTFKTKYLDLIGAYTSPRVIERTVKLDYGGTSNSLNTTTHKYRYIIGIAGLSDPNVAGTVTSSVPLEVIGNFDAFQNGKYSYFNDKTPPVAGETGTLFQSNPKTASNIAPPNGYTFFYLPENVSSFELETKGNDQYGFIFGTLTTTVTPPPAAPTSGGNQTVCWNGNTNHTLTATATAPQGQKVTWYETATGGIPTTPTQVGVGTKTYYAQSSNDNGTCPSLTRTAVTLTINAAPAAPTSGGNQTVCSDGTTTQTLTATATVPQGSTISWFTTATGGTALTTAPTQVGVGSTTYYAQSSNGTCPSLTRTAVTLTINAAPAAPTSGENQTVCSDGTTTQTLTATATVPQGSTISWFTTATGGTALTTAPTQVGVGSTTYYAQSSNGTCSSLTRTAVILTINAAPAAPTSGENQTVCSDGTTTQTLTATATVPQGSTISWFTTATGGTALTTAPTQAGVGSTTYYAQSSNGTCSSLTRTAVTLTINAAPAAPTSGGNQTVCSDGTTTQTLTATATVPQGSTISWFTTATGGTALTTAPTQVGVGSTTYYAQSSNGTCSSLTRTAVILTINAAPAAPTSGENQTVCSDGTTTQTLTATATVPQGSTISWFTTATGGTALTTAPTQVGVGSTTYYAQSSNGTCSSLTRTAVILTINAAPAAPTSGENQTVCSDGTTTQTLTATATVPQGSTISWFTTATGGTALTTAPTQVGVGSTTYYAQSSNGTCSSLTRTAVKLTITPNIEFTATPTQPICVGEKGSVVLSTPNGGTGAITFNTTATTNLEAGDYTYTATDANGCTKSITVTITEPTNALSATATSQINVSCKGGNDGSVVITPAGGTAGYTITPTQTGLAAGDHTFTVKDAKGCQTTVKVTILDGDGTPPTFTRPADITIYTTNTCSYDATIAVTGDVTNEADNISTRLQATYSDSNVAGTCQGSRIITRTWSLVDNCGNKAADQVQTITVSDNLPPTWTTAATALNTTIECSNTEALATAQAQFPVASDNCDADVTNIVKTTGQFVANEGCANSGTYTNTWTVTDACGNKSAVFTQVITIEDKTAPVIAVPPTRLSINCPETPAFAEATATDNCDNAIKLTFEDVTTPGECAGSYSVTRTWTAKDACGNTSTAYQTIRVKDITAPVITTCAPNQTIATNSNCEAIVPNFAKNVIANDTCTPTDALIITQTPAAGSVVSSGTTTITISVKDACGNESTCESKLIVTNFIVANDDAGTNVNGYAGGISFTNVLSNDLLNCKTVNTENANITFVSSTNSNISLSGTNVIVAPGTPAGNYSLVYQICEKLNPANCDTATVTVTVTTPVIDAINDNINGGNGTTGNANAGNVLAANPTNADTLNGNPVTIAQVNLSIVTPATSINGAPVPSINTTTGQVSVPAGTPAGNYTIVYSICEKLNPANCDTATAIVTVTAPVIDAINDNINGGNGTTGNANAGNVLAANPTNADTLNGNPVTIAQVNLSIVTPATSINGAPVPSINTTTGQVSVPAGTPAGNYTIVYSICEKLNPANCDTATAIVTVTAPVIDAINDNINGGNGTTGNANAGNVLAANPTNADTLNGNPVTIAQVNLSIVTPATSINGAPVPSINTTTGQVSVPAGTPAGNYTIVYSICEKLNPANCDTATVTITVVQPDLNISALSINNRTFNCDNTGLIFNLIENVTINGSPVTLDLINLSINSANPNITLDNMGNLNLENGIPVGIYPFTIRVCEKLNPDNCKERLVNIIVQDITAPVIADLPAPKTISCGETLDFAQAVATDVCSAVTLTFVDTKTNGLCAGSYSVTRTWTAVDASNNTTKASQTINVQDLLGPTTTTVFPASVDVACDAIPAKPNLVFVDNCSAVASPVYTENIINQTPTSYSIVREWNVADACGNPSRFVQTINVTIANAGTTIASSACNADSTPINLNDLLPAGTASNGTWINVDNIGILQGSMFNPLDAPVGDHIFEYTVIDGSCPTKIRINMNVNFDCKVLGCEAIVVHKAFTPNNDGINEKLIIDGVNDTICYPSGISVEIYNRWGVLVFETAKYDNETNAFEGYSKGRTTISQSDGLPTGTYFYIVNYESFDGNGNIQINKKDGFLYLSR